MTLKFLRIFGHLIVNISIDFTMFRYREHQRTLVQYLIEYGSNSFIDLTLGLIAHPFPEYFDPERPFTSVRILQFELCDFRRNSLSSINTIFPKIHTLKLGQNTYKLSSAVKVHFPSVKHLSFDGQIIPRNLEFESNDVEELLRLNPHIEKLELQLPDRLYADSNVIQIVRDNFLNLKHFKLKDSNAPHTRRGFTPVHFDQIEHFSWACWNGDRSIPFSFSKLKHVEFILNRIGLDLSHPSIPNLIDSNENLTSIFIRCGVVRNIEVFFEFKNVLTNIEAISIGFMKDVRSECVLQFLKQNQVLKRFSMIGVPSAFYDFAYQIISDNANIKIRNNIMEFMIERECDRSSTKYFLRKMKWICYEVGKYEEVIQCCTYDELQTPAALEDHERIKAVKQMQLRAFLED